MNIQILTQVLHGDAGALNVPAGVAHAPGGIPLEGLILELGLGEPEDEVVLVALVRILLHALAHADGEILLVEVVADGAIHDTLCMIEFLRIKELAD